MADNHVFVPMQLDVMVLNPERQLATPFNRFTTSYLNLNYFADPEPPFPASSPSPPASGIYLHWTMPKALRQGVYKDDGTTDFPFAPNRWLVVRVWADGSGAEAVKAWVLESDFLDDIGQHTQGTSPFIDPTQLNSYGTATLKTIGRARRLEAAKPTAQPKPFLKAVGPGSLTFASYSPNVDNVFAFTDTVLENDDKTQIPKGTFAYYVAGWYSDPNIDPLSGTSWKASTDAAGAYANSLLDWYVMAGGPDIPTGTLVHALVSDVVWDVNADPVPQNYPTDIQKNVKVAIGNTAVDALSAMVRLYATADQPQAGVQADLLEAFQYGLLSQFDQPGSSEALNMAIRQHWYGASSGGTLWQIVAKERSDDTALPAPPAPKITPQQATLLAALNTQQAELDRQQRILESMQWNLYALWWKNNWVQHSPLPLPFDDSPQQTIYQWFTTQLSLQVGVGVTCNDPTGTDPSNESWYFCKVQAQKNLVAKLTTAAAATQNSLQSLVDAGTQVLKGVNMPQFFYPNDPVLLVTGLGRATNFDPQGELLCRLPAQQVNTLTVNGTTYTAGGNAQAKIPPLNDPNGVLPSALQQLHAENVFLWPAAFAGFVLGDPTQAAAVAAAIDSLPKPAPGVEFPPLPFALSKWEQPWVPLLLDWQVAVLQEPAYTSTPGQRTCTFNQGNWQFDGADYKWAGPVTASGPDFNEGESQMVLEGRTFITPSLTFTLADQLDAFVRQHKMRDPNLEKLLEDLDHYLDGIRNQDFLSQRLSGLMSKMIERDQVQTVIPTGAVAALLGDRIRDIPMPYPDKIRLEPINPAWDFGPLGGTFFVLQKLTVTDTFGRTIDLMLANYNNSPERDGSPTENYFYPITGRNMKSPTGLAPAPDRGESNDATERMIQLTPRVVQDTRLTFRLASNDGHMADLDQVVGANPVCGWIVPNHLDRSLALYAPDGKAWGELYLSVHYEGKYVPVWQPDPTDPQAPQTVGDIPNQYVRAMLEALTARADDGAGFSDFLQVIDETLWTINPQGQRTDQNLSVLIGRPLAVVRAEASLNLRGVRYFNQDWWNTFGVDFSNEGDNLPDATQPAPATTPDGGVESLSWPVRLGSHALRDDGLVGYYFDDPAAADKTFKVFNTVNLPSGSQTDYLKQIGAADNYLRLRCIDDTVGTPDPAQNQICGLTMLVDPRGSVHAFTGLLPVARLSIPSQYVTPALQTMYYTFRAGPFLTSPDAVRIPRPAESQGVWTWFDNVLKQSAPVVQADQNVSITLTPPLIKEGWLKFTPNPPQKKRDPAPE